MLVEILKAFHSRRDLLLVRITVEPHAVRLGVPEIGVRLQHPVHIEDLLRVIIEVVPVLASKHAQDGSSLVEHLGTWGLLPDGHLTRGEGRFDLRPLLKCYRAIGVGNTLVRQEHANGLGLSMKSEVGQRRLVGFSHLSVKISKIISNPDSTKA